MIKKVIIRILLAFMLLAFSAVVVVQWLWIEHAFEEQRNRFSSRVYDVLNRVTNRVEELNYVSYVNRMELQVQMANNVGYNRVITSVSPGQKGITTTYTFDVSKDGNGMKRKSGITYLSVQNLFPDKKGTEKIVNQELMVQAINSMEMIDQAFSSGSASYDLMKDKVQELTIRLMREKDLQHASVRQRLRQVDLPQLLKLYFYENKIGVPFSYEVLTKKDVLEKVKNKEVHNFYYVPLFPNDYIPKDYYLGVSFDSVQSVIVGNMGWLLLASGFCIFGLLFVFVITIVVIMRQQKLSVIKNDFINNMTHEFKTPIATISLATSAIAKEKVLADQEQLLKFNDMIRSENERMNVYVERILQQAKLDRRELPLNKTEVDMNDLIEEAAATFLLQVQNAGGVLKLELKAPGFIWMVDEVHMMNVVCNLLDNAVKYSAGAPVIDVYTRKEGRQFIVGVRDQGIGISREAQKKVFHRFYRVTTGNLHNVKGFGLGLSYVKSIVELHGGTVRLVSKKYKGTLIELIF